MIRDKGREKELLMMIIVLVVALGTVVVSYIQLGPVGLLIIQILLASLLQP